MQAPKANGKDSFETSIETRKLRNRISQRAFRARQAMRIRELEQKLGSQPLSETARVQELEDQTTMYRNQLLEVNKKMESLQITMKALVDSTASVLGMLPTKAHSGTEPNNDIEEPNEDLSPEQEGFHEHMDGRDHETETTEVNNQSSHPFGAEIALEAYATVETFPEGRPSGAESDEFLENYFGFSLRPHQGQHSTPAVNLDHFNSADFLRSGVQQRNENHFTASNSPIPSPLSQLPLKFSFSQIGPKAYAGIAANGPLMFRAPNGQLRRTCSSFSDHITAVEFFLKQRWENLGGFTCGNDQNLAASVSFMLSVFVCMSWQTMTPWHTYTRAHCPVGTLMTWHVHPTTSSYLKIAPCYRPTTLQFSVPHPAVIDWIPWPALRDKLIIFHSGNPKIDDLIVEIGDAYAVEGDLSTLISGITPVLGFVGVWDLVRSISPEAAASVAEPEGECDLAWDTSFDPDFSSSEEPSPVEVSDNTVKTSLPATSVTSLFNSKVQALEAFYALGMDRGADTFRLDPAFFEKHPELYDSTDNLMARGVPLRPPKQKSIPIPRTLDSAVLSRYQELTKWTLDPFQQGVSHAESLLMV